jgi:hypothetical protein
MRNRPLDDVIRPYLGVLTRRDDFANPNLTNLEEIEGSTIQYSTVRYYCSHTRYEDLERLAQYTQSTHIVHGREGAYQQSRV